MKLKQCAVQNEYTSVRELSFCSTKHGLDFD